MARASPLVNMPCGDAARRFVYKKILNLAFVRYVYEYEYLKRTYRRWDKVLLTDVRDVIFQDDLFRDPLPAELVAFLEAPKMVFGGEPLYNDPWVRKNYDNDTLTHLSGHGVSCCGTVMGTATAMLDYLEAFVGQVRELNSLAHGADTSIHNVLVREILKERFAVVENLEGAVATLANEQYDQLQFDTDGYLLSRDCRRVPVIHQYLREHHVCLLRTI